MAIRRMFSDLVITTTTAESVNLFLTKLGHVVLNKATEFVVIEDFGCSPSADWALVGTSGNVGSFTGGMDIFMNIRINTTAYFTEPDGSQSYGIRGLMNPYPELANLVLNGWNFEPKVYVLPGQTWDTVLYHGALTYDSANTVKEILGMVVWTLYDGVDAVIANKLLELGLDIKPENIDWYKRLLIKQENRKEVK